MNFLVNCPKDVSYLCFPFEGVAESSVRVGLCIVTLFTIGFGGGVVAAVGPLAGEAVRVTGDMKPATTGRNFVGSDGALNMTLGANLIVLTVD